MNLNANITSLKPNEVSLCLTNDDELVINKTISLSVFIDTLIEYTKTNNKYRVGNLPSTYFDGLFDIGKDGLTGEFALFIPSQIQRMEYKHFNKPCMVSFPSLMFFFTLIEGVVQTSSVFSLRELKKSEVNEDTMLFNYPFGNVSAYTGRICWGSNPIQRIRTLKDLDNLVLLFINSPTNTDNFISGQSVSELLPLTEVIKRHIDKDNFDINLLVPAGKTIKEFLYN